MKTLTARAVAGVLIVTSTGVLLLKASGIGDDKSDASSATPSLSSQSLDPDSAFFRGEYETAAALYRVMALAGRERISGQSAELGVVRSLIAMGRFDEAERFVHRLEEDSTNALSVVDSGLLICLRSEILTRRAEVRLAVDVARDCRRSVRSIGEMDSRVRWYTHYVSAFAHAEADEFDVALRFYLDALTLLRDAGLTRAPEYARTINHVANVHYRTGSLSLARRLHEEALEIRRDLFTEHHPAVAASYGNIGNVFHEMGDFESALDHHLRALSIWTRSLGAEHPQTAYSLNNIGYALNRLERFDEAEYYLLRARELKVRMLAGSSLSLARTHRNLADAYLGQGNTHLAKRYVDRALSAIDEAGHHSDILAAQALASKAAILRREGETDEADSALHAALGFAFDQNHPYAVKILNRIARAHLQADRPLEALDATDRAVDFGARTRGRPRSGLPAVAAQWNPGRSTRAAHAVLAETHHIRSAAYMHLFDTSEDSEAIDKALVETRRAIDTLQDSPLIRDDLSMSSFLSGRLASFARSGLEIASELSKCACGREPIRDALTFSNILKNGFEYTETLVNRFAVGRSDSISSNRLDSLELELFETRRQRAVMDLEFAAVPGRTDALDARIFEIRRTLRTERGAIRLSDEPGVLDTYDPGPIDRERIPGDLVLLDYVLLPEHVITIKVSRFASAIHETPRTARLNAMLDTFPEVVRRTDPLLFSVHAGQLYEALVRPLEIDEDATRLLISPHETLWDIPFEALVTGNRNDVQRSGTDGYAANEYLIHEYSVSYMQSAAGLLRQSTFDDPPGESTGRLLAAAPGFDYEHALSQTVREFLSLHGYSHLEADRHTALSGSIQEVKRVSDLLKRSASRMEMVVYTDILATEYDIKYELSLTNSIVHIATHGYTSSARPQFAGLLLSPDITSREDGILYAEEIRRLPIRADLVVVSACYSGYSNGGAKQEYRFIHALSSPDIHNIILALWPIPDQSSSRLISDMYQHIAEGYTVENALRYAKLLAIGGPGEVSHPSKWAPFVHLSNSRYGSPII